MPRTDPGEDESLLYRTITRPKRQAVVLDEPEITGDEGRHEPEMTRDEGRHEPEMTRDVVLHTGNKPTTVQSSMCGVEQIFTHVCIVIFYFVLAMVCTSAWECNICISVPTLACNIICHMRYFRWVSIALLVLEVAKLVNALVSGFCVCIGIPRTMKNTDKNQGVTIIILFILCISVAGISKFNFNKEYMDILVQNESVLAQECPGYLLKWNDGNKQEQITINSEVHCSIYQKLMHFYKCPYTLEPPPKSGEKFDPSKYNFKHGFIGMYCLGIEHDKFWKELNQHVTDVLNTMAELNQHVTDVLNTMAEIKQDVYKVYHEMPPCVQINATMRETMMMLNWRNSFGILTMLFLVYYVVIHVVNLILLVLYFVSNNASVFIFLMSMALAHLALNFIWFPLSAILCYMEDFNIFMHWLVVYANILCKKENISFFIGFLLLWGLCHVFWDNMTRPVRRHVCNQRDSLARLIYFVSLITPCTCKDIFDVCMEELKRYQRERKPSAFDDNCFLSSCIYECVEKSAYLIDILIFISFCRVIYDSSEKWKTSIVILLCTIVQVIYGMVTYSFSWILVPIQMFTKSIALLQSFDVANLHSAVDVFENIYVLILENIDTSKCVTWSDIMHLGISMLQSRRILLILLAVLQRRKIWELFSTLLDSLHTPTQKSITDRPESVSAPKSKSKTSMTKPVARGRSPARREALALGIEDGMRQTRFRRATPKC